MISILPSKMTSIFALEDDIHPPRTLPSLRRLWPRSPPSVISWSAVTWASDSEVHDPTMRHLFFQATYLLFFVLSFLDSSISVSILSCSKVSLNYSEFRSLSWIYRNSAKNSFELRRKLLFLMLNSREICKMITRKIHG